MVVVASSSAVGPGDLGEVELTSAGLGSALRVAGVGLGSALEAIGVGLGSAAGARLSDVVRAGRLVAFRVALKLYSRRSVSFPALGAAGGRAPRLSLG